MQESRSTSPGCQLVSIFPAYPAVLFHGAQRAREQRVPHVHLADDGRAAACTWLLTGTTAFTHGWCAPRVIPHETSHLEWRVQRVVAPVSTPLVWRLWLPSFVQPPRPASPCAAPSFASSLSLPLSLAKPVPCSHTPHCLPSISIASLLVHCTCRHVHATAVARRRATVPSRAVCCPP